MKILKYWLSVTGAAKLANLMRLVGEWQLDTVLVVFGWKVQDQNCTIYIAIFK